MKQVTDLIIADDYEATLIPTTDIDALGAGLINSFNFINVETGAALAAVDKPTLAKYIKLCVDSDGNRFFRESLPFHVGKVAAYNRNVTAAATAKTMTATLTGLAVPIAGLEYVLQLTDSMDFNYIVSRRRISYVAVTGDSTTDVAAGLAAAITADPSEPNVTATNAAAVITIVGANVPGSGNPMNDFRLSSAVLFDVILQDNLTAGVLATTVVPDPGCGTYNQIADAENVYKGYKGVTNNVIFPSSHNVQYDANPASGGYDLYVIEHVQPQHSETIGDIHGQVVTTLAVETAYTNKAAFDLIWDGVLGLIS